MSTSTSEPIYVWTWLPGQVSPVPAGVLVAREEGLAFRYGQRYLERADAISLGPALPLSPEWAWPSDPAMGMPSTIRDAAPDAWGMRVVLARILGRQGRDVDVDDLTPATYLLESGSDRIGALDFQASESVYVPRVESASLDVLHNAADMVEAGTALPPALAKALLSGTAVGGARPKALLADGGVEYLAKFSTSSDHYPVVGAEAVSIELARHAGLRVPEMRMVRSLARDVLLMERFDRNGDSTRRHIVSALTLVGLTEMGARHTSYPEIVDRLRLGGAPDNVGAEVFQRAALNIAISNTDDHARNHAAFWDGARLTLTPAYDLSPVSRSGESASHAIALSKDGTRRQSRFADLAASSADYGLSGTQARETIDALIDSIHATWAEAADAARLTEQSRAYLWGRQILNPAASFGYKPTQIALSPGDLAARRQRSHELFHPDVAPEPPEGDDLELD